MPFVTEPIRDADRSLWGIDVLEQLPLMGPMAQRWAVDRSRLMYLCEVALAADAPDADREFAFVRGGELWWMRVEDAGAQPLEDGRMLYRQIIVWIRPVGRSIALDAPGKDMPALLADLNEAMGAWLRDTARPSAGGEAVLQLVLDPDALKPYDASSAPPL